MAHKPQKTSRGRPPTAEKALMQPIMIRFPHAMVEEIDELIAKRVDQPDRSGFIRELIAEALEARRKGKR